MRGIVWAGAAAFLLKIFLAVFTAGTNDALTWEQDLKKLDREGFAELYRTGVQYSAPGGKPYPAQAFIHPPGVLHLLRGMGKLQEWSGVPLRFWLRTIDAGADAALLALLAWTRPKRTSILLALSPVSILISGFHGNTDPLMMLLAVAAVVLLERGRTIPSGIVLGMACAVKLVPLLFVPAMLWHLASPRNRARWSAAAGLTWIALSLPYLAQQPVLIVKTMLGYGGATGVWGFSLLSTLLGGPFAVVYESSARWIALTVAAGAPLIFDRRGSLFRQCGLVSFAFLFLTPGFGLQYLCWTVPWSLCLNWRWMAAHHAAVGGFLLIVYAAASRPVFGYADLITRENLTLLMLFGLICWAETGVLAWRWKHLCTGSD